MRRTVQVGAVWLALVATCAAGDLEQAGTLFDEMKFDQAMALVNQVLVRSDIGPDELVEAWRIKGLCLAAKGSRDEALRAFQILLSIRPGYKMDRGISPKVASAFYQAVAMAEKGIELAHSPPKVEGKLAGLELKVRLVSDPLGLVKGVRVRYQPEGGEEQALVSPAFGPATMSLSLPDDLPAGKLSYYVEALNDHGAALARIGEPFQMEPLGEAGSLTAKADPEPGQVEKNAVSGLAGDGLRDDGLRDDEPRVAAGEEWYETWWFWTAVGVVVVGGTVGGLAAGGVFSSGDAGGYEMGLRFDAP
ncbi:MAG: tetratricopeptide repeat protein [Deltaproteobacteria bacterium]|nr:tetratricopeptide repeat protein [Deltaproteobacteria bacterium]